MGEKLLNQLKISPQPGPQTQFLSTSADIAGYGGSAGGGKSYALLLDALRGTRFSGYDGAIFRRTSEQIRMSGGLWDESTLLYSQVGGASNEQQLRWKFPGGSTVRFEHLQHEKDKLIYQGAQFAFLGFDELTHFSESQFFYMISRLRSTCGIRPYCRATFNPDPDSWVKEFFAAWVDPDHKDPAESGEIRSFVRDMDDNIIWVPNGTEDSTTVTFIRSRLTDNQILMQKDPSYIKKLMAMPLVDRRRLLDGEWADAADGDFWKKEWFQYVDVPMHCERWVRFWDFAATEQKGNNDPDYTASALVGITKDKQFCIADVQEFRGTPLQVQKKVEETARRDSPSVEVVWEEEGGSGGKFVSDQLRRVVLCGFSARGLRSDTSKSERAKAPSAATEAGNVFIVRGDWNKKFTNQLCKFPNAAHDDMVDTFTGAYRVLAGKRQVSVAV
jgi:predicted phage terminase large subunit-like protein